MKLPNFFIVGAPKCGTTALDAYLQEHPKIFMCEKEPHYFSFDLPGHREVCDWSGYEALFQGASDATPAVGETSVYYLYSQVALEKLHQHFPSARVLVMLRNPFELAVSMHAQALRSGNESVTSFAKAWSLCDERRAGRKAPKGCHDVATLLYDSIPLLGSQLQRLLDIFPAEQVRWWFYEDFAQDTRRVYLEILDFLGVPDDGRTYFPRHNPRRRARSQLVAKLTQRTPEPMVKAAIGLKRVFGIKELGIIPALREMNWTPASKTSLSPELLAEMRKAFEPDIRLLQNLTGKNLESWLLSPESSTY